MIRWTVWSGIPIAMIVAGILWYNRIRFGSFLDFGYTASLINIGLFKDELQAYGQFNVHFIARNLQVMLIGLPSWDAACGFFAPSEIGLSILITTPALVYLYRSWKNARWVQGAWASITLFLTVLLLHYSTGAIQFGYRFLMDMIIPVVALLGLAGKKEDVPLSMKILILGGILVNYWGIWWFFTHWCR